MFCSNFFLIWTDSEEETEKKEINSHLTAHKNAAELFQLLLKCLYPTVISSRKLSFKMTAVWHFPVACLHTIHKVRLMRYWNLTFTPLCTCSWPWYEEQTPRYERCPLGSQGKGNHQMRSSYYLTTPESTGQRNCIAFNRNIKVVQNGNQLNLRVHTISHGTLYINELSKQSYWVITKV